MENYLEKNLQISVSMCGSDGRLRLSELFTIFMDIAGEHAEALGIGFHAMREKGFFWLTVKTKIRIHALPSIAEAVTLRTWPGIPERMRGLRYYTLSSNGVMLAEGKTEWAALEIATGRIHTMDGMYPEGLVLCPDTVCEGAFTRINPDFSDAELLGRYTVRSTDIDVGRHMNNAAYLRALSGLFSSEEEQRADVHEAEALFRTPSYEGQELTFLTRTAEDGHREICALLPDGKPSFMAVLR